MGGGIVGERSRADRRGAVAGAAGGDLRRPTCASTDRARGAVHARRRRRVRRRRWSALVDRPEVCRALGRNARAGRARHYSWARHVERLWQRSRERRRRAGGARRARQLRARRHRRRLQGPGPEPVEQQPGRHPTTRRTTQPHTLEWFLEVEALSLRRLRAVDAGGDGVRPARRRATCSRSAAAWAPTSRSSRRHGALVTDVDLSAGHLRARAGELSRCAASQAASSTTTPRRCRSRTTRFDVVYSNGVLHHTPNTRRVVAEILRVLQARRARPSS